MTPPVKFLVITLGDGTKFNAVPDLEPQHHRGNRWLNWANEGVTLAADSAPRNRPDAVIRLAPDMCQPMNAAYARAVAAALLSAADRSDPVDPIQTFPGKESEQ